MKFFIFISPSGVDEKNGRIENIEMIENIYIPFVYVVKMIEKKMMRSKLQLYPYYYVKQWKNGLIIL